MNPRPASATNSSYQLWSSGYHKGEGCLPFWRMVRVSSWVSERFRSLVILFVHECVCHRVMVRCLGIAIFRGEKKMSAGLAARTTALCFMGKGPPRRWDAARDNCLEKAQPSEADHQFARRVKVGIRRYGPASWFGRRSSQAEGVFVSTAGCSIAFSHAGWTHERGDCSSIAIGLKPHCAVSNDTAKRIGSGA
jgi:hypothetical protein